MRESKPTLAAPRRVNLIHGSPEVAMKSPSAFAFSVALFVSLVSTGIHAQESTPEQGSRPRVVTPGAANPGAVNPNLPVSSTAAAAAEAPKPVAAAPLTYLTPSMIQARISEARRMLKTRPLDRKSTRLNSSHSQISYAVFCL